MEKVSVRFELGSVSLSRWILIFVGSQSVTGWNIFGVLMWCDFPFVIWLNDILLNWVGWLHADCQYSYKYDVTEFVNRRYSAKPSWGWRVRFLGQRVSPGEILNEKPVRIQRNSWTNLPKKKETHEEIPEQTLEDFLEETLSWSLMINSREIPHETAGGILEGTSGISSGNLYKKPFLGTLPFRILPGVPSRVSPIVPFAISPSLFSSITPRFLSGLPPTMNFIQDTFKRLFF